MLILTRKQKNEFINMLLVSESLACECLDDEGFHEYNNLIWIDLLEVLPADMRNMLTKEYKGKLITILSREEHRKLVDVFDKLWDCCSRAFGTYPIEKDECYAKWNNLFLEMNKIAKSEAFAEIVYLDSPIE